MNLNSKLFISYLNNKIMIYFLDYYIGNITYVDTLDIHLIKLVKFIYQIKPYILHFTMSFIYGIYKQPNF